MTLTLTSTCRHAVVPRLEAAATVSEISAISIYALINRNSHLSPRRRDDAEGAGLLTNRHIRSEREPYGSERRSCRHDGPDCAGQAIVNRVVHDKWWVQQNGQSGGSKSLRGTAVGSHSSHDQELMGRCGCISSSNAVWRRYVSTKHGPVLPPRPRQVPLRSISRIPSDDTSHAIARPRLPDRLPDPVRRAPGRPVPRTENQENMLLGVRASDKLKEKISRQKALEKQALLKRYTQVVSEATGLLEQISQMQSEMDDAIDRVPELGRSDYRCFLYTAIDDRLESAMETTTKIENVVSSIRSRRASKQFQNLVYVVDRRLLQLQDVAIDIEIEVESLRDAARREKAEGRIYHLRGAQAILRDIWDLKGDDGENHQLWQGVHSFSDAVIDLGRFIEYSLVPLLPTMNGVSRRKLCEIRDSLRYLARPNASHALAMWGTEIMEVAHFVREVEFNRRVAKNLPEITFASRWATTSKTYHIWSIREHNDELRSIATAVFGVDSQTHGLKSQIHVGAKPARRSWLKKVRLLPSLINSYTWKSNKLTQSYLALIGDGLSSLCPHPNKEMHEAQIKLLRPITEYGNNLSKLSSLAVDVRLSIYNVCQKFGAAIGSRGLELRRSLMTQLLRYMDALAEPSHPLSRRGNRLIQDELRVWHSVKWVRRGANQEVENTREEPSEVSLVRQETSSLTTDSVSTHRAYNASIAAWPRSNSLYPSKASVMIDVVSSHETLQQVVEEVSHQSVIGLDVVSGPSVLTNVPSAELVIIASHKNVYILDMVAIRSFGRHYAFSALEQIIENPEILKVGTSTGNISKLLCHDSGLNLTCTYDVLRDVCSNVSFDVHGLPLTLEHYFRSLSTKKDDSRRRSIMPKNAPPMKYLHYLAMQAFAPLMLFADAVKDMDVCVTDAQSLFHLTRFSSTVQRQDMNGTELGPVNVDRSPAAHHRPWTKMVDVSAPRQTFNHSRSEMMRTLSLALARQFFDDTELQSPSNPSKRKTRSNRNLNSSVAERGVAAYYLATVFGERLRTIEKYLGLDDAASGILWAEKKHGLRLNEEDRIRYQVATKLRKEQKKVSVHRLSPSNVSTNTEEGSPGKATLDLQSHGVENLPSSTVTAKTSHPVATLSAPSESSRSTKTSVRISRREARRIRQKALLKARKQDPETRPSQSPMNRLEGTQWSNRDRVGTQSEPPKEAIMGTKHDTAHTASPDGAVDVGNVLTRLKLHLASTEAEGDLEYNLLSRDLESHDTGSVESLLTTGEPAVQNNAPSRHRNLIRKVSGPVASAVSAKTQRVPIRKPRWVTFR